MTGWYVKFISGLKTKKAKDENQKEVKIEEEGSVIVFAVYLRILRVWR